MTESKWSFVDLKKAAEDRDWATFTRILNENSELKAGCDTWGFSALHMACWKGASPEIVLPLLRNRSQLKDANKFGNAPLHLALASKSDSVIVFTMIENGSDVGAINAFGQTALHIAFKESYAKEVLLRLIAAASAEDLLKTDKKNATIFPVAFGKCFILEVCLAILEKFAKHMNDGSNVLHVAFSMNAPSPLLSDILKKGIPADAKDQRGKTPFDYCTDNKKKKKLQEIQSSPSTSSAGCAVM